MLRIDLIELLIFFNNQNVDGNLFRILLMRVCVFIVNVQSIKYLNKFVFFFSRIFTIQLVRNKLLHFSSIVLLEIYQLND